MCKVTEVECIGGPGVYPRPPEAYFFENWRSQNVLEWYLIEDRCKKVKLIIIKIGSQEVTLASNCVQGNQRGMHWGSGC